MCYGEQINVHRAFENISIRGILSHEYLRRDTNFYTRDFLKFYPSFFFFLSFPCIYGHDGSLHTWHRVKPDRYFIYDCWNHFVCFTIEFFRWKKHKASEFSCKVNRKRSSMSVTPWTSKTCGENGKLNTTCCIPERVTFCGKKVKRVFFFLRYFLFFNYLCTIFKRWSMIDTSFYKIFYFFRIFRIF